MMIVAELSANHKGSIDKAFELMTAARRAGADAVKLQAYTPDSITIRSSRPEFTIRSGQWAGRTLYDLYQEAQTPLEWLPELFRFAYAHKINCFASPFDCESVDILEKQGCQIYKIASFEIVDLPLIAYAAKTGKELIISTGMASDDEIEEALMIATHHGASKVTLLHCVSEYPACSDEATMKRIPYLREKFGVNVGLSDHSIGTMLPIIATALGASVIEKHFTISRDDGGLDASFSSEPNEFAEMCTAVRSAQRACSDRGPRSTLKGLRRSIYVTQDVKKGEMFTPLNIRSVRPGAGMLPKYLLSVIGTPATKDIEAGTPLTADMIW